MAGFSETLTEMVDVAGDYCHLIDNALARPGDWLAVYDLKGAPIDAE